MGAIFKKLRGLLAKFWAELQIFLNTGGPRVDFRELWGLFNKNTSRSGIFGSGPLDRNPMARVCCKLDLIGGVRGGSGGQGVRAHGAAAGVAGVESPRWSRAGVGQIGHSGLGSA